MLRAQSAGTLANVGFDGYAIGVLAVGVPQLVMLRVVEDFFFFQAEDGIRDHWVTGVQTCALPIFSRVDMHVHSTASQLSKLGIQRSLALPECATRSEERRVGKEGRSRWSSRH